MNEIEIRTEAEFRAALKLPNTLLDLIEGAYDLITRATEAPVLRARAGASLRIVALESSQPRVVALESSQPRVEAWESSQPRVVAREFSQPRVVALESSQPRVVARGTSQPRIEAWGTSHPRIVAWGTSQPRVVAREFSHPRIVAWGTSQPRVVAWGYVQLSVIGAVDVRAAANVAVLIQGNATVRGGTQTRVEEIATPREWCDYYGVEVKRGVAILYKAVDDSYRSTRNGVYTPGTTPEAADWDGMARECGGGLHFCPTPSMARSFQPEATRYVACPVRLSDMVAHPNPTYPTKIKARRVAKPIYEVDEDGERIA